MNAQLRPATLTESELRATIYFAVGVASEGSLRGRNVAYDLAFAGYIHQAGDTARGEPREAGVFREGQLEPIYNSGYSIGTLQADFGQQRNDVNRNADRLLDAYQAWAQEHTQQRPDLALTPAEYDMASDALRRQGNEIRGDRQVVTDNGYDVPAGIKTRLSEFLGSDDGITFVHNQDIRQVNHLLRNGGSIRQLEDTLLYQNATADDQIRMATVISKLENQDGRRNWPRIVERIESGAIDSVDDLKAAVPRHLHGDRDNALRGAELVISLRGSEANNPLHAAWQSVLADPLVNPTQLDQDRTRPNLLAEYSTVKNLFLVPAQGRAFVEALDVGGTRTQDVRFQGAPAGHTAGLYASGSDLVQWNRNGHGHAYVGGEWREIERSQVTRTDRDNGVVELNVARDGVPAPLLHIDPRAPRMQPRPDLPQDVQRQPGGDGSSIHNRGPEQGQQADGRQRMLYDPPGRWEESLADRYLAAVMSGDSALADRAAVDFARSAEGRHMEAQGERLLAQQQAAEQSQAQDRQMTR